MAPMGKQELSLTKGLVRGAWVVHVTGRGVTEAEALVKAREAIDAQLRKFGGRV